MVFFIVFWFLYLSLNSQLILIISQYITLLTLTNAMNLGNNRFVIVDKPLQMLHLINKKANSKIILLNLKNCFLYLRIQPAIPLYL